MGCYPCSIKGETNCYQQKQGYPQDYRTTLILQTKILKQPHSALEYTRGLRQGDIFCPRVYSGSAFKGNDFLILGNNLVILENQFLLLRN